VLDQHSLVPYLHEKGLSPKERDNHLGAAIRPEALAYDTLAYSIQDAKRTDPKITSPPDMISPQLHEFNQAILLNLEEWPFR
jgi:hypothetical protein